MPDQVNRPLSVTTPLGDDVLAIRRFRGSERLGRPFEFQLDLLSTDFAVSHDAVLGEPMCVRVPLADGSERYFHGIVSRFAQTNQIGRFAAYRATIHPWLWLLTRTSDFRIFQEMKVPDIVKQVFRDNGFSDFDDRLSGEYREWEYCVQFRETAFNFVSRLMEHEGIYTYFEHEQGRHTLVLADGAASHDACPGYASVEFHPEEDDLTPDMERIYDWTRSSQVQPGVYALNSFDFKAPRKDLAANTNAPRPHSSASFEMYDYPGDYWVPDDGDGYSRVRLEEHHAQHSQVRASGNARGLYAGGQFALERHPRDDQNGQYLVVGADYDIVNDTFETGESDGREQTFGQTLFAIPADTQYRSPRITPKPLTKGPQTATVVGPSGEEIYTDEYGRVKVHFHWDRHDASNEESSCWLRVASVWAGKQWGGVHIPRIGQEVIVDYLEGDPDQPIITGRIYNADNMPPYGLPANKTQSGIKSRSSKGGTPADFNEIRFEDKKGSEELYLHAQKDHTNITENDRSEDVGHDRSLHVGNDKSEAIDNNKSITVGVDHKEEIGASKTLAVGTTHTETIGTDMKITVGSNLTEMVTVNYSETVGAAMQLTVGAALTETVGAAKTQTIGAAKIVAIGAAEQIGVGGSRSLSIGGSSTTTVGGTASETVTGAKSLSAKSTLTENVKGPHSETVEQAYSLKAKTVSVVADDSITLKVGKASITLDKSGDISVSGKDVQVNGSGKIQVKAKSNLTLKGRKILEN